MSKTFSMPKVSLPKMNVSGKTILHNRFVLYFVFLVSLVNLFMFVVQSDFMYAVIFVLVGFLTSFFSKNMIVILCIALAITNILKYGVSIRTSEGFNDNGNDAEEEEEDTEETNEEEEEETDDAFTNKKEGFRSDDKKISDNKSDAQGIKEDYMKLMEVQKNIVDNMTKITEPLAQAEEIVDRMRAKQEKFKNKKK